MTRLGFALSMAALVGMAAWTYHINYRTKTALKRIDRLRAEIAAERESIEVLRVEWAYLNAPERLERLVALNNDQLGLVPMRPQHFDGLDLVSYPSDVPDEQAGEAPATDLIGSGPESEVRPAAALDVPLPLPRPASWRAQ